MYFNFFLLINYFFTSSLFAITTPFMHCQKLVRSCVCVFVPINWFSRLPLRLFRRRSLSFDAIPTSSSMAHLPRVLMVRELGSILISIYSSSSSSLTKSPPLVCFHQVAEKPSIALSIASVLSHGKVVRFVFLIRKFQFFSDGLLDKGICLVLWLDFTFVVVEKLNQFFSCYTWFACWC